MSDLNKYINKRKKKDPKFAENFETGFNDFKIGLYLRELRIKKGFTQEDLAVRLKTKKSVISRMENHAEDIRLSTLEKVAKVLGKKLHISIR
ncbi:XRE family transcriptional regulator [Leptospira selangorensis]|uniref:XRE family transcriptional regulator n=1 Tax=Leptospira selangorensis TaxID=2484982 RepID=A0A4V3JC21_9LEPT|nr:helix-turn-helix transcriptional regulator [Leptospira selangorensis]TGK04419.1 XRE family transcriptional regulator [Leptospira selangorensis]TGM11876.1 XRE family transcriptional regulator [Leptospira selangorensis]TGM15265.1 XRE family transcriptional regulator [Leptospira selangorensis]